MIIQQYLEKIVINSLDASNLRLLMVLLCLAPVFSQASDSIASNAHQKTVRANWVVMLDPSVEKTQRMTELAHAKQQALMGESSAQYVLGALYRLGMDHPAKLVERDENQAARYLSNAAINGRTEAMAGMAELRLDQKNYADAYVWASVYAHYQISIFELWQQAQDRESLLEERPKKVAFAPYAASLLERCKNHIDANEILALEAHSNAFITRYDERIRSAIQSWDDSSKTTPIRMIRWGHGNAFAPEHHRFRQSGLAMFLNGVNAEGKVEQMLVIDSLPTGKFARAFERISKASRYELLKPIEGVFWSMARLEINRDSVHLLLSPTD